MTAHKTGTREEWLAARLELLEAEKALTRRGDELAQRCGQGDGARVCAARTSSVRSGVSKAVL